MRYGHMAQCEPCIQINKKKKKIKVKRNGRESESEKRERERGKIFRFSLRSTEIGQ